jgi:hypothetical protein
MAPRRGEWRFSGLKPKRVPGWRFDKEARSFASLRPNWKISFKP